MTEREAARSLVPVGELPSDDLADAGLLMPAKELAGRIQQALGRPR